MIRDLRFDEIEQADRRKRLVRIVVVCLLVSTLATFVYARERALGEELAAVPVANPGDVDSMRARRDGLETLLDKHHVWLAAFDARKELGELVRKIHEEEKTIAKVEAAEAIEAKRIREEAQAARSRGNILVQRKQYSAALIQYRSAAELADSLGENGWQGGTWKHREQIAVDILELEAQLVSNQ